MPKSSSLFCLILGFIVFLTYEARAQITFNSTYNNGEYQRGTSIIVNPDTTYSIAGNYGRGYSELNMLKIDERGELLWNYIVTDGPASDVLNAVTRGVNGGYTYFNSTNTSKLRVIHVDEDGSIIWQKGYSNNNVGFLDFLDIVTVSDGYIGFNGWGSLYYFFKIDVNGDMIWETAIKSLTEGTGSWGLTPIVKSSATLDGGCIGVTLGADSNAGQTDFNGCIMKVSATGDLEWNHLIGEDGPDIITDILATSDSCYVALGHSMSYGNSGYDIFVIKYDYSGNLIWSNKYGGVQNQVSTSVLENSDKSYSILGAEYGLKQPVLFKIDTMGNFISGQKLETKSLLYDLEKTLDGGYVAVGGEFVATNYFDKNIFVVKFDSLGRTCNSIDFVYEKVPITVTHSSPFIVFSRPLTQVTTTYITSPFLNSFSYICEDVKLRVIGDTSICLGDSVNLIAVNDTQINWHLASDSTTSIGAGPIISVAPVETISYLVIGERDTASITIYVVNDGDCLKESIKNDCDCNICLYPNPTNGRFEIESQLSSLSYDVIDINGRIVKEKTTVESSEQFLTLADATYFIRLYQLDGEMCIKRIVIQH